MDARQSLPGEIRSSVWSTESGVWGQSASHLLCAVVIAVQPPAHSYGDLLEEVAIWHGRNSMNFGIQHPLINLGCHI